MLTLNKVSALTEDEARETIERILWPNGPICAHCGATENVTRLHGKAHRVGVFQCNNCHEQFTVTVGTIFEDSHISLRKWLMAFALLCSAKKGISALQLQRELEFGSYRTAWHLAMRIRHAMSKEPLSSLLKGTIEVDETYVGGKPRPGSDEKAKRGRGTKKIPVVALVERDGRVRAHKIERVDGATLKAAIRENVDRSSRIMTDEWSSYRGIGAEFVGGHEIVTHSAGEYARGDTHVNTAESYFALLKRGVIGSFHHISKQHLDRYCDEFSFRWDHRSINDSPRTEIAIRQTKGRRLSYRWPDKNITG
jgi:transposase-like protein